MDLQNVFYIVGIVFMGLMLIILGCLVVAVFVIRSKITAVHKMIEEKLNFINKFTSKGTDLVGAVHEMRKKL